MFTIKEVDKSYMERWDSFVDRSINGTIHHRMKFLSYHGDKFGTQEKYIVILKGKEPWSQISFRLEASSGKVRAFSPYGGSHGGFIFNAYPSYQEGNEMLGVFLKYIKEAGVKVFVMTPPLLSHCRYPLDVFYFNLLQHGFCSLQRDISNVLYFTSGVPVFEEISTRARNMYRKAESSGLNNVLCGDIEHFYHLLKTTYNKFDKRPTHTLLELKTLKQLFPKEILFEVAYQKDVPIAGVLYIADNSRVASSFYHCQDPLYRKYQGLTFLILKGMERFQKQGFSCIDFGTSTVQMKANENLFLFKESFTKTGVFRETFQWVS
jgi:hypothetical protein